MIIRAHHLFRHDTFEKDQLIYIKGNKIERMVEYRDEPYDQEAHYVIPGLIDVQLNGGGGFFFTNDISEPGIHTIEKTHLKYGTTGYLITLTTCPFPNIFDAIELVKEYQKRPFNGLLGLHIEGPYLNHEKKGAHPAKWIRKPNDKELAAIIKAGRDVIKIITIAPELFSARQINMIRDAGITISAGHSNATYEEAINFFSKGVTMATHLFNAMSAFESRSPGLVGALFDREDIWANIIVDGKHVHYKSVDLAYRMKKNRLFLISDASFKDEPGTKKNFGDTQVLFKNGFYYTLEGRLAGSSLSMLEAVKNSAANTSISFETAIQMATSRPLNCLGMTGGEIKPGKDADLILLDDNQELQSVIFKGTKQ